MKDVHERLFGLWSFGLGIWCQVSGLGHFFLYSENVILFLRFFFFDVDHF